MAACLEVKYSAGLSTRVFSFPYRASNPVCQTRCHGLAHAQISAKVSRAAWMVLSTSSSVCASDVKPACPAAEPPWSAPVWFSVHCTALQPGTACMPSYGHPASAHAGHAAMALDTYANMVDVMHMHTGRCV